MSIRNAHVVIKFDTSGIDRALRRVSEQMWRFGIAFQRMGRNGWRNRLTPGERHIDRIAQDCLARRLDPATTARRLMVATDAASVIDGMERAA